MLIAFCTHRFYSAIHSGVPKKTLYYKKKLQGDKKNVSLHVRIHLEQNNYILIINILKKPRGLMANNKTK